MLSILPTIYADVEAMTVTYTDKSGAAVTPKCYGLAAIPASVQTAMLPCRVLLPLGQGRGGSPNIEILRGAGARAAWTFTDLFLLAAAAQDIGLNAQAPSLVSYAGNYAESLSNLFQIKHGASTNSITVTASIALGMYEYPASSGAWWYGCKCDITIEEII